ALDQRICEQCGRMHHAGYPGRFDTGFGKDFTKTFADRFGRVVLRGEDLVDIALRTVGVLYYDIREGAADIDAYRVFLHVVVSFRSSQTRPVRVDSHDGWEGRVLLRM